MLHIWSFGHKQALDDYVVGCDAICSHLSTCLTMRHLCFTGILGLFRSGVQKRWKRNLKSFTSLLVRLTFGVVCLRFCHDTAIWERVLNF